LYGLNHSGVSDCYIRLLPEFCPKFFQGYKQATSDKIDEVFQHAIDHNK
jgi:hypothetical protein